MSVPFYVAPPLSPHLPSFHKGSTISISWVSTKLFCSMFSFSCDLFTFLAIRHRDFFFSLSSLSVLLVHKCVGCAEACTWWDLTRSISPGQIRIYLLLTAHISPPQNAVLHVILILTVKAALKSHLGLLVIYWLQIPCFKEGQESKARKTQISHWKPILSRENEQFVE